MSSVAHKRASAPKQITMRISARHRSTLKTVWITSKEQILWHIQNTWQFNSVNKWKFVNVCCRGSLKLTASINLQFCSFPLQDATGERINMHKHVLQYVFSIYFVRKKRKRCLRIGLIQKINYGVAKDTV